LLRPVVCRHDRCLMAPMRARLFLSSLYAVCCDDSVYHTLETLYRPTRKYDAFPGLQWIDAKRIPWHLLLTRMWDNAQPDGRPAEYRWRPLFNAAKFGWRPLLECRAVTLPRRETRWNLLRCPKLPNRSQPLVSRSSPYYGDMWRRYCCLTIFSDCRLRRYSPIKLCDGAQMANFWRFFVSCIFSEPRAAGFRPAS